MAQLLVCAGEEWLVNDALTAWVFFLQVNVKLAPPLPPPSLVAGVLWPHCLAAGVRGVLSVGEGSGSEHRHARQLRRQRGRHLRAASAAGEPRGPREDRASSGQGWAWLDRHFLLLLLLLQESLAPSGTFSLFASLGVAAWLFVLLQVPETRGLELEEIQAKLQGGEGRRG